ncbi:MAG: hypothetical protein HC923_00340 [Myxococcales bacterium]|nr:hypothetical protein [Myxococcales bacterium]
MSKTCCGPFTVALVAYLIAPTSAWAAFPVETLEGLRPGRPFPQVHLGLRFDQDYQQATINREFISDAGTPEASAGDVRELDYESVRRRLVVEARAGIYERLELRLNVPVVLSWDSNIGFADGTSASSTVFGSSNADDPSIPLRFPLTTVPAERSRSGLGDLEVGLAFSPVVDAPARWWPTMTIGLMVTLPTGDRWDPADPKATPEVDGTGGVGLGQTIFDVTLGLSKRTSYVAPSFDPYFIGGVTVPVPTGDQEDIGLDPPVSARVEVGSEIIFVEDTSRSTRYAADIGFSMRYIGDGRTFSPLSDFLPDFNQTAIDRDTFRYSDFANPGNYSRSEPGVSCVVDSTTGAPRLEGVPCGEFTRVQDHVELEARLGFRAQPSRWFMLRAGVGIGVANDHLITGERAGTDRDPASAGEEMCGPTPCLGRINRVNSQGVDERSRFYDPRYDAPGTRFLATDILNIRFFVTGTATF